MWRLVSLAPYRSLCILIQIPSDSRDTCSEMASMLTVFSVIATCSRYSMEQEWTAVITIGETDPAPQAWNVNALSGPVHTTAAVEGRQGNWSMFLAALKVEIQGDILGFALSKMHLSPGWLVFIVCYELSWRTKKKSVLKDNSLCLLLKAGICLPLP